MYGVTFIVIYIMLAIVTFICLILFEHYKVKEDVTINTLLAFTVASCMWPVVWVVFIGQFFEQTKFANKVIIKNKNN